MAWNSRSQSAPTHYMPMPNHWKIMAWVAVGLGHRVVTGLTRMDLFDAGVVSLSWLIGYLDFSLVWSFLLTATLFVVWKVKVRHIIKQHPSMEETDFYQSRPLNETAGWLNVLINRWWVLSSGTIEQLVKKRLDERLRDTKLGFLDNLELTSFAAGEQTPSVHNVQVFEYCEGMFGSPTPVRWFEVDKPPPGLNKMSSYQLVVQFDARMICKDFQMVFWARVGSSMTFELALEDLQVTGRVQAILHLSMDEPFPHVSKASVCLRDTPDVKFNLRLMKFLPLMKVPLLKTWIHSKVMEALSKAMELTLFQTGSIH